MGAEPRRFSSGVGPKPSTSCSRKRFRGGSVGRELQISHKRILGSAGSLNRPVRTLRSLSSSQKKAMIADAVPKTTRNEGKWFSPLHQVSMLPRRAMIVTPSVTSQLIGPSLRSMTDVSVLTQLRIRPLHRRRDRERVRKPSRSNTSSKMVFAKHESVDALSRFDGHICERLPGDREGDRATPLQERAQIGRTGTAVAG